MLISKLVSDHRETQGQYSSDFLNICTILGLLFVFLFYSPLHFFVLLKFYI